MRNAFRFAHEGLLLIIALAFVASLAFPVWQWIAMHESTDALARRLSRLLIGIEQFFCYLCFFWAFLILVSRWWELGRQRRPFQQELLPVEEEHRLLPEDARIWQRRLQRQTTAGGHPTLLGQLLDLALGRFSSSRHPAEVAIAVREAAELAQNRLVTSISLVQYLVWAIPALGFIGTARGMGLALAAAPSLGSNDALQKFLDETTRNLGYTFDCTLVALTLSVILMLFIHVQQRMEENLVLDAQQYCLERLLTRLVTLDHMVLLRQPHHALGRTESDSDIVTSSPAISRDTGRLRESRITRDFGHGLGGLS